MRTALIATTLIAVAVASGCGAKPPQGGMQMPPPQVGIATPIARELPSTRDYTGRIEAAQTVEIRSRVSGFIKEVHVRDGAEVKEGDLLFTIDEAPLKTAAARAEAEAVAAKTRRDQAQITADRNRKMVQDQIVSQQVADDSDAALRTAEAQYTAAKAALATAKLDLGYARISSPISGRLGKVLVTEGNLIQPAGMAPGTHLATVVSVEPVLAAFDLDEATYRELGDRLRASTSAQATVPDRVAVAVALAGESGFPHPGHISFIDNQVDTASASIRVRATISDPKRQLTPGAFARIQVQVAPPRPVLLVNERAIQAQLATRYVLAVDEKGGTSFRPVKLGATIPQEQPGAAPLRVVEWGLGPSDRIAVNNLAKIFYPGMAVAPQPASMLTTENDAAAAPVPAHAETSPEASSPGGTTTATSAKGTP